jgi:hypothetical protein
MESVFTAISIFAAMAGFSLISVGLLYISLKVVFAGGWEENSFFGSLACYDTGGEVSRPRAIKAVNAGVLLMISGAIASSLFHIPGAGAPGYDGLGAHMKLALDGVLEYLGLC